MTKHPRHIGPRNGTGARIRRYRQAAGLKRMELAAALGCHLGQVVDWESGGRIPEPRYLLRLADVLGCYIEDLLDRADFGMKPEGDHAQS